MIVDLLGAWILGHVPAVAARYGWKKAPLSLALAGTIAVCSGIVLALAITAISETFGWPETGRIWASNGAISALLSIVTMTRGKRELLTQRLLAMIADPATPEDRRALAREKLALLEARGKKPSTKRPLA